MYVLMVVPSDFPDGDAGALRDLAFANIYQALGYEVVLIGVGKNSIEGNYNGIIYYSVFQKIDNLNGHLKRFVLSRFVYLNRIKRVIESKGLPKIIHVNDISHGVIKKLRKMAKKENICITHDSTEWYSPCEFSRGKIDKQYILKNILNKYVICSPVRIYAISSFLEKYFTEKGMFTCRIPVIMDVENAEISRNPISNKIKLIYAGSPGKKDYLDEMVLGIEKLSASEKERVEFNIFGASVDQVKSLTGITEISDCIKIHGHVLRDVVQKALLESDFSILLRPEKERYAKAGFPTKSVEAMSHGVAMVCNISSDLGLYLKDMENSVIVNGHTAEALTESVRRLLTLSNKQINEIKRKAHITALQNFDYRLWIDVVNKLLR